MIYRFWFKAQRRFQLQSLDLSLRCEPLSFLPPVRFVSVMMWRSSSPAVVRRRTDEVPGRSWLGTAAVSCAAARRWSRASPTVCSRSTAAGCTTTSPSPTSRTPEGDGPLVLHKMSCREDKLLVDTWEMEAARGLTELLNSYCGYLCFWRGSVHVCLFLQRRLLDWSDPPTDWKDSGQKVKPDPWVLLRCLWCEGLHCDREPEPEEKPSLCRGGVGLYFSWRHGCVSGSHSTNRFSIFSVPALSSHQTQAAVLKKKQNQVRQNRHQNLFIHTLEASACFYCD